MDIPFFHPVPKEKTPRDQQYLNWLKTMPCAVPGCDKFPSEYESIIPCHPKGGGVALKASDREALPMCNTHHQEEHQHGFDTFWKRYDRPTLVRTHLAIYERR